MIAHKPDEDITIQNRSYNQITSSQESLKLSKNT